MLQRVRKHLFLATPRDRSLRGGLMEEFRGKPLNGEWWLPSDPNHVFKGS
jgi:hypothetical protein